MRNWLTSLFCLVIIAGCGNNDNKKKEAKSEQVQAIDELKAAVKSNPDSTGLRLKLINSLDSLHQYADAIAQTDSLIAKDSANSQLWMTRGQLLENVGDTANAIISYDRALRIYPSPDAQLYLANLFAETKDRHALELVSNIKKMKLGRETDANANFVAGVYYARKGETSNAVEFFNKAINDNYTLMEAYMEKGFIYFDKKKLKDAVKVFETAITVNNTYADAHYWKAKCLEAQGKKSEAIEEYQLALGFDKQMQEAKDAIGRLQGNS